MSRPSVTAIVRTKRAVIFDLFHTLTSLESTWDGCKPAFLSRRCPSTYHGWGGKPVSKIWMGTRYVGFMPARIGLFRHGVLPDKSIAV